MSQASSDLLINLQRDTSNMTKYKCLKVKDIKTFTLRLLTHVGFLRQNGLILSEVFLYLERRKNHEKRYIITVQKNFTFLRRFDRKNTDFGISRNLIDKFVFK